MKFLSLKNPKAVTFLFNVVTGVLALLVIYSIGIAVCFYNAFHNSVSVHYAVVGDGHIRRVVAYYSVL